MMDLEMEAPQLKYIPPKKRLLFAIFVALFIICERYTPGTILNNVAVGLVIWLAALKSY